MKIARIFATTALGWVLTSVGAASQPSPSAIETLATCHAGTLARARTYGGLAAILTGLRDQTPNEESTATLDDLAANARAAHDGDRARQQAYLIVADQMRVEPSSYRDVVASYDRTITVRLAGRTLIHPNPASIAEFQTEMMACDAVLRTAIHTYAEGLVLPRVESYKD